MGITLGQGGRTVDAEASLLVGRHPDSDLVVDDLRVSGRHAQVEWREGRWRVRDLGSKNGTSLGGRRVDGWRPLSPGQVLRFAGGEPWTVLAASAPASVAVVVTDEREGPGAVALAFHWTGMGTGEVELSVAGRSSRLPAGVPFILLERLWAVEGAWVPDEELRQALWGRMASQLSRSALHAVIREARALLVRGGAPASLVEKRRGRTRLRAGEDERTDG